MNRTTWLVAWTLTLAAPAALAVAQAIPLIDAAKPEGGWQFGNGPEFPGAAGSLRLLDERYRDKPVLGLEADFSKGGNYVQASVALPDAPIAAISFWVEVPPGVGQLPVRLVDGSGQCHQLRLKLGDKGGWQRIDLPIVEFFRRMGTSSALDIAGQYEKWGGADDGKWHQPGRLFVVLFSRAMGVEGRLSLSDVVLQPDTRGGVAVEKVIRLDEILEAGEIDWGLNLGEEFPGAKGGLEAVADSSAPGKFAMRLHADFTAGGGYVGARRSFANLDVRAMKALRFKMCSPSAASYSLRLVDGAGQTHQRKGIAFQADGQWHDVEIVPEKIAGGEHWGGPNDGQWRDSVQLVELMLNPASDPGKKPEVLIADIRAEVVVEARPEPAAFTADFDGPSASLDGWRAAGDVKLDRRGRGADDRALLLRRDLEAIDRETAATGPAFDVAAGSWQTSCAWKADLHSPDNSYHGAIALEVLDRAGGVLETIPVAIGFGHKDWQSESKAVTLPAGAAQARFRLELVKTYGSFWVDNLAASPLSTAPVEQRVERILLAGKALGHLFLPGDPVAIEVTVEANKPLPPAEQRARYQLRDAWGAEQAPPGEIALEKGPRKDGRFTYVGEIRFPDGALREGKFHELDVEIPQDSPEPPGEYTGLAVLPPAAAKSFEPDETRFTIRNWDSRVPVYFRLADRLGIRLLGIWGGWEPTPPYRPHAPGIELCAELSAKWITGTPAAVVERKGFDEYDETALREGMRNFLEQYAARGLAMIALGNEPHGTGRKVLDNVRAYKAIYETVKAFDPHIHVIGTSVEPNEEYFRAGYQNYLDSYDFHIYEHYSNVRRTMRQYRELMEKYGAVKPIHSTELGLNSQGQTRQAVAIELVKKCVVFFAEGGATVSWFTIQYPDPQGKARGQFGDSHCVFDCKYNLYNPRLDAITYYHLVNAIGVKRFVEEHHDAGGVQAYLFRDAQDNALQVLWLDERREDARIPLPEGTRVQIVHIDGTQSALEAGADGITLTLSPEPVMLLYRAAGARLAASLAPPSARLVSAPPTVVPGRAVSMVLEGAGLRADALAIDGPAAWKVHARQQADNQVELTIEAPRRTAAREARFVARWPAAGPHRGELLLAMPVVPSAPGSQSAEVGR